MAGEKRRRGEEGENEHHEEEEKRRRRGGEEGEKRGRTNLMVSLSWVGVLKSGQHPDPLGGQAGSTSIAKHLRVLYDPVSKI